MRILLFILWFAGITLNAQDHPFGIKIGGNVSNLSGDGTEGLSALTNFHAGFFMDIAITEKLMVQPELMFTVYGFKIDEDSENENVRLNYVVFPVMAKYFVSNNFSFDAGPQVGLLVTAKNGTGSLADVRSNFYDRDFGVNIGSSLVISEKVTAYLRYYFGFTDVTAVNAKNFNRAFQFGLQFKLK